MALSGITIIIFGLLVALMGCLNGQPTHPLSLLIKARGRTARIQCKVASSTLQSNALHWYRLKDQAFQRLMYFEAGAKKAKLDSGVPSRYSGSVNGDLVTLTISTLELSDAGAYYCALWSGEYYIKRFGSGTRLIVTAQGDDKFKSPTLTGYIPSKTNKEKSDKHGKQTLLCQATDMFPDLVKFEWKKKELGKWTDVSEGDVVEQTNSKVNVISMLIVDKDKAQNDNYQCTVIHEGNTAKPQTLDMKKENSKPTMEPKKDDQKSVTCPPSNGDPITTQISGDSEQIPSMFLFVYAYGVLLMKNGLFFCVVSIFLLKRKAGRKDKSSET